MTNRNYNRPKLYTHTHTNCVCVVKKHFETEPGKLSNEDMKLKGKSKSQKNTRGEERCFLGQPDNSYFPSCTSYDQL